MAKHRAAAALGKRGGSVSSAAKARASRENGKKGGRPPRWIAMQIGTITVDLGDEISVRSADGMILVNGKETGQRARIKRGTS
jgi:hypothetical protein